MAESVSQVVFSKFRSSLLLQDKSSGAKQQEEGQTKGLSADGPRTPTLFTAKPGAVLPSVPVLRALVETSGRFSMRVLQAAYLRELPLGHVQVTKTLDAQTCLSGRIRCSWTMVCGVVREGSTFVTF